MRFRASKQPPPAPSPLPRSVAARLEPKSAPGTRRASMFFDDYPAFYETSQTTPQPSRLNLRYEAIIGENQDILQGARVLDIASHDGRWSFAALKAGATHVVGIEAKQELTDNAARTFDRYGVEPAAYEFVCGDIFEVMASRSVEVDVVLCLGFLYHTLRYNELLSLIRQSNPKHVIVDTSVIARGKGPLIQLRAEDASKERNAVPDRYSYADTVLGGKPNLAGLRVMFHAYGFNLTKIADWGSLLRDNPESGAVDVYARGERVTVRCDSV
jgi:hypothetical protein